MSLSGAAVMYNDTVCHNGFPNIYRIALTSLPFHSPNLMCFFSSIRIFLILQKMS